MLLKHQVQCRGIWLESNGKLVLSFQSGWYSSCGNVLAVFSQNIGLTFVKSESFPDNNCNPCGHKTRNLYQLFTEIGVATSCDDAKVKSAVRSKRQLLTSVSTPDWSLVARERRHISSYGLSVIRKVSKTKPREPASLFECDRTGINKQRFAPSKHEQWWSTWLGSTRVKVVIVYPSRRVVVRMPVDKF